MEQQEFNVTKHLKSLWRFKWLIALVVLLSGGTALVFTLMQPPIYEATATVMVESGGPSLTLPAGLEISQLQDVGSQIEVMRSRGVLERAVSQLEPEKAADPDQLQLAANDLNDSLRFQQVRGTNVVALTIISSDAAMAQKQADAVAEAYVYEASRIKMTSIEDRANGTDVQIN